MDKQLVADVYKLHGSTTVSMPADSSLEDAIGTLVREPSLRGSFLVDTKQRLAGMLTRVNLIRWAHLNLTGGKGRHNIPISEFFRIIDARKAQDLVSRDQPPLQIAFKTVPLGVKEWAIAILPGVLIFFMETLRKIIAPRLFSLGKWQPSKRS